jgi:hypothetical protein
MFIPNLILFRTFVTRVDAAAPEGLTPAAAHVKSIGRRLGAAGRKLT